MRDLCHLVPRKILCIKNILIYWSYSVSQFSACRANGTADNTCNSYTAQCKVSTIISSRERCLPRTFLSKSCVSLHVSKLSFNSHLIVPLSSSPSCPFIRRFTSRADLTGAGHREKSSGTGSCPSHTPHPFCPLRQCPFHSRFENLLEFSSFMTFYIHPGRFLAC